jgi:ribonuclease P protein component
MRREQRLRRRKDFDAIYRKGQVSGNRLLVVRVRPNGLSETRFGFVAGKAVGNAVTRNRVKRRLRAIAQHAHARDGLDIVVGARRSAVDARYNELERAFTTLLRRAGALRQGHGPEDIR